MGQADKVNRTLDAVITVLTKSNTIAEIAGVAAAGVIALFKSKGVEVPQFTQEELNAAMHRAAETVTSNASELQARIRAEFPNVWAGPGTNG